MTIFTREGRIRRSPLTIAALAVAATTVGGAGAATVHRFAATQTTGSGNATAFVNPSGGALQGEVASSANTSIQLPFGVLGEYNAGSSFGIGVAGISTTGYAVGAEALGGSAAILALNAGTSDGLDGIEKGPVLANGNSISGVMGESDGNNNFGVYGYDAGTSGIGVGTAQGVGVIAETNNGIGMAAVNDYVVNAQVGGGAFQAALQDGRGVVAKGNSGGATPALEAFSGAHGTDAFHALVAYSATAAENEFYIQGLSQNRSGTVKTTNAASDVQMNGDLYITGAIYSGCNAFPTTSSSTCTKLANSGVARSNNGDMVQTYGSEHASPTLEDEGEARMVGGYSHVALDPTFARTMSTASPYMVFVTPEGDSALYVTNKSASGFDVRAVGATHASLAFSYRIVARPFENGSSRMAIVSSRSMAMHNRSDDGATFVRLRSAIGRHHARATSLITKR